MPKDKHHSLLSFASGFVQNRDIGRVIAQIDQIAGHGEPDCWLMKWTRNDGRWFHFDLAWTATRMWVMQEPQLQVFSTGPEGSVSILTSQGSSEEMVDESGQGPKVRGHIRDLRGIGKHLYVCGMGRQVYRREGHGHWARIDQGIVLPLGDLAVAGLNSIDGLTEDDIYAVGYNGEIWRRVYNTWRQLNSPTNVILHRTRVIKNDLVFACGQKGVLLRGRDDCFEIVPHDATRDHLWGMEWFMGKLYVSSDDAIYALGPDDDLRQLDLGKISTCGHLHANDGVMWSFGTKHVAWTEDGVTWNDVTP